MQRTGKVAKVSMLGSMVLGHELGQLGPRVSTLDHPPRLGEATGAKWVVIMY